MDPTNLVTEQPMAACFGAAGLICQLAWPLFSSRRAMLGVQIGVGTNFGAQYALIDAWTGAAVCALGATQTLIALAAGDRTWLRWMGLAFLPIVTAVCVMTWSGPASFCSLAACSLVMLARLQSEAIRLRTIMLSAAPFGMGHDIAVGSLPGFAGACASALLSGMILYRELRRRHACEP